MKAFYSETTYCYCRAVSAVFNQSVGHMPDWSNLSVTVIMMVFAQSP